MALHSRVCFLVYCRSRGWLGSSRKGRFTSARSATVTSKAPWARARPMNHCPMGKPARPGRVEAMTTVSVATVVSAPFALRPHGTDRVEPLAPFQVDSLSRECAMNDYLTEGTGMGSLVDRFPLP